MQSYEGEEWGDSMNNKIITLAIGGAVLLLFSFYFVSLHIFFPSGEPIKNQLKLLTVYAEAGKWKQVDQTYGELEKNWNLAKHILTLNYAESDYSMFLEYMGRLKGAIKRKEIIHISTDSAAMQELWNNFIRIIPEP